MERGDQLMTVGALTWQILFPSGTSYVPCALPEEFRELLASTSRDGPSRTLVTSESAGGAASRFSDFDGVVGINAPGLSATVLSEAGFSYVRRFAVVPSLRDARWFIPLDTKLVAAGGFGLYAPLKTSARLKRAAAVIAARTGLSFWYRDEVVIGQRTPPPIEAAIGDRLPRSWMRLALSSGTAGPPRKPTVAALDAAGRPLAIAKVAVSTIGERFMRHEAQALKALASMARPTPPVAPRLLFDGMVDGSYSTIQSPLVGAFAGARMTPAHTRFLESLRFGDPRPVAESAFVRSLRARHAALPMPSAGVRAALDDVLAALEGVRQPPCIVHGDFAPWNLREHQGKIAAFDWEYSELDGIPLVDEAHHLLHVGFLIHGWSVEQAHERVMTYSAASRATLAPAQTRTIVMAAVIDVILRRREEGFSEDDSLHERYGQLLARLRTSESEGAAA